MENIKNIFKKENFVVLVFSIFVAFLTHAQALFFDTHATDVERAYETSGSRLESGRFFGYILDNIFAKLGFIEPIKYINIILYFFCIAFFIIILFEILNFNNIVYKLLIVCIVISCPVNTDILTYPYVSHMYGLSLLIASIGCFLMLKLNLIIPSIMCFVISIGIYQAFFPTIIFITYMFYLKQIISGDDIEIKKIILKGIFHSLIICISLFVYVIINNFILSTNGYEMSSYLGMSNNVIPKYTLFGLTDKIILTYRAFANFCFSINKYTFFDNILINVSFVLFTIFLLVQFIFLFIYNKRRLLLILFFVLIPFVTNLPFLIMDNPPERIILNIFLYFTIPIFLFTDIIELSCFKNNIRLKSTFSICIISMSIVLIGYNCFRANKLYSYYTRSHEIASKLVYNIENKIINTKEFQLNDPIILVGELNTENINTYFFDREYNEFYYKVFRRDVEAIFRKYALFKYNFVSPIDVFIAKYDVTNIPNEIEDDYFCIQYFHTGSPIIHSSLKAVHDMPSYPNDGCFCKVGEYWVFKLSN